MMTADKISLILLALMLIPLIAAVGPQALGALAGAAVMLGMVRITGRKQ
jgi:DNA-binding protein Fis